MIFYHDGFQVRPGDVIDHDGFPGVVEFVIESPSDLAKWDIDEPGIMATTEGLGLNFHRVDSVDWPEVVLIRRAEGSVGASHFDS